MLRLSWLQEGSLPWVWSNMGCSNTKPIAWVVKHLHLASVVGFILWEIMLMLLDMVHPIITRIARSTGHSIVLRDVGTKGIADMIHISENDFERWVWFKIASSTCTYIWVVCVSVGSKNGYQKDMSSKETGLVPNVVAILGLIMNIIEEIDVIILWGKNN